MSTRSSSLETAASLVQEVEKSLTEVFDLLRAETEQPDRLIESMEAIQRLTAELSILLRTYSCAGEA